MKVILLIKINNLQELGGGGSQPGTQLSLVSEAAIAGLSETLRSIIWLSAKHPTTDRHSLIQAYVPALGPRAYS